MSYEEQKKRITIKIIPHANGKLISFEAPKFFSKLIISLIIVSLLISSLGFLYYYKKCTKSSAAVSGLCQVEKRNRILKNRLQNLAQEANLLEAKFKKIKQTNKRIKRIISYNVNGDKGEIYNQQELFRYQKGNQAKLGISYKFDLNSNSSRIKLIDSAQDRLIELKEVFFQKQAELNKLK